MRGALVSRMQMTNDKGQMTMRWAALLAFVLLMAPGAQAVKIGDITRLNGERSNVLVGWGLVFGLKGTGDGGEFGHAIRPLREMLEKMGNPGPLGDLTEVKNVALVYVTATLPEKGVRGGDRLDVRIASVGGASSLRGGRLALCPLLGPIPGSGILAMAEGPITLEDPTTPTAGVVKRGMIMEADLPAKVIEGGGRITLILDGPAASWTTASTIAKIINDAEGNSEVLAVAVDGKNVIVNIPPNERERPNDFIARVTQLPVRILPSEAKVLINEKTGTIIMTGDVEISPVVISHKGLTITTIAPPPVPTRQTPVVSERTAIALDTTAQGGAKLQELVDALDAIKVTAEDRIAIVKELHKTGYLHAKLIVE